MGWANYLFLGSLGNRLDLDEHEAGLRSLRQSILSSRWAERDQASPIESLYKENQELRVYLTALIQFLIHKGAITPEEMSNLAEIVERSGLPESRGQCRGSRSHCGYFERAYRPGTGGGGFESLRIYPWSQARSAMDAERTANNRSR